MLLLQNFQELFFESAPWLLLGFIIAGLMKVFIPMQWMNQQLGGKGFKPVIKAALLGAPLPLCSCGVIPAAFGLRRAGASKAATTSFLISTPETGVDSISISYVLLGPFMAVVRPIAAILSALTAGFLVNLYEKDTIAAATIEEEVQEQPKTSSCCSKKKENTSATTTPLDNETWHQKIRKGLTFSITKLVDDTMVWLLIGLGFAAIVQTFIPQSFLSQWGSGLGAMLIMILISIPMYICATASTPIAAGLLLAGVSPGAVLVFMLAGPASNIATLGLVRKELGSKALAAYLSGVVGIGLMMGLLVDHLVSAYGFVVTPQIGPEYHLLPHWLIMTSGIALTSIMLYRIGLKVIHSSKKAKTETITPDKKENHKTSCCSK